ncbi:hypothetical protein E2C01_062927 [Portunus trituberculatus]|uniref:Uncharacterized protein n=1 Tax=Portunus trituberculatus TaxID=210409 RepID=A0A5B7HCF4_PORTR|nr:hypothetical protein [Portunus trituberculatus]
MVLENYPAGVNDFLPDYIPVLAWRGSCGTFLAGSSGITYLAKTDSLDQPTVASIVETESGKPCWRMQTW